MVALVITIIVLLILAGVTLIAIMKDNGLIIKIEQAKQDTYSAQLDENTALDSYANLITGVGQVSGSRSEVAGSGNPTGTVISYITGNDAPEGYLKCDGTVYNISEYQRLADAIKNGFGKYDYWGGDGETTFAVPNLQGEFLRGTGTNSHTGMGAGANVGIHQDGTWISIPGTYNSYITVANTGNWNGGSNFDSTTGTSGNAYAKSGADSSSHFSYTTIRPTNTSVLYCIKY